MTLSCKELNQHVTKIAEAIKKDREIMDELSLKKDAESQEKRTKMILNLSKVMEMKKVTAAMKNKNCDNKAE